jgi:hypothetical protein
METSHVGKQVRGVAEGQRGSDTLFTVSWITV